MFFMTIRLLSLIMYRKKVGNKNCDIFVLVL